MKAHLAFWRLKQNLNLSIILCKGHFTGTSCYSRSEKIVHFKFDLFITNWKQHVVLLSFRAMRDISSFGLAVKQEPGWPATETRCLLAQSFVSVGPVHEPSNKNLPQIQLEILQFQDCCNVAKIICICAWSGLPTWQFGCVNYSSLFCMKENIGKLQTNKSHS